MQHSPCEIKDKLLRALDKDYNVVDMATVLEVISSLEKAIITRETLEKTRIGKYINELRKKTSNEQLARRAKELVKSWRKLLPQIESSINGERVISNITAAILGPGPGPGIGPGPGPGNKLHKTNSPSVSCKRSASPFCSSASNSPQFSVTKLQVTNRPLTPSSYAPSKLNQAALRNEKDNNLSSQVFKPVSPALAAARFASSGPSNVTDTIPHPKPQNLCFSPAHLNNSRSCSPFSDCSTMNAHSESSRGLTKYENPPTSPCLQISTGSGHSILETAKTNVANKRLRKSQCINTTKKTKSVLNDLFDSGLQNGIDALQSPERLLPSESSAFKTLHRPKHSKAAAHAKSDIMKGENLKSEKTKRASDMQASSNLLKEKISSLNAGAKISKVKTTQQLRQELQARKDALSNPSVSLSKLRDVESENENSSWKKSNYVVPNAELFRSKSELMKKFLSSSPESPSAGSCHGSPVADRVSSPLSDNVPSKSSVIMSDFSIPYTDPISVEIEQILSTLPPINPEEINLDDDEPSLPERKDSVDSDCIERLLSEHWDGVNGNSVNGSWMSWQECIMSEVAPGEMLRILPYVNID